jgi:hypothetical protein
MHFRVYFDVQKPCYKIWHVILRYPYMCVRTHARVSFPLKTERKSTKHANGFAFGTAPSKRQAYFVSVLKGSDDVTLWLPFSGLCLSSKYCPKKQRFGTGSVCHAKRWKIIYSVGFVRQSESHEWGYYECRPVNTCVIIVRINGDLNWKF